MNALIRSIVAGLVGGGAIASIGERARRIGVMAAGIAAAMIFFVAAIGCGMAALWIAAIPHVGRSGAPLVVAAVLLLAGAAVVLIARRLARRAAGRRGDATIPDAALAAAMGVYKENKSAALLAALVAGLAAGRKTSP